MQARLSEVWPVKDARYWQPSPNLARACTWGHTIILAHTCMQETVTRALAAPLFLSTRTIRQSFTSHFATE